LTQLARFFNSQGWTLHSIDLNLLHYSVLHTLQEPVYEGRREPFKNLKGLQSVITDKWHDVDIRQSELEKPCCSEKSI